MTTLRKNFSDSNQQSSEHQIDSQTKKLVKAIKDKDYTKLRSLVLLSTTPIDVNAVIDDRGTTPLMLAASLGDFRAVDILAQVPSLDVNVQNKFGNTALILAAKDGYTNIVKTILSFPETNVNHKNKMGQTAFLLACAKGQSNTVDILRHDNRVDVYTTDLIGNNGLKLAELNGHKRTIEYLRLDGRLAQSNASQQHRRYDF